jgi:hypothetical protein
VKLHAMTGDEASQPRETAMKAMFRKTPIGRRLLGIGLSGVFSAGMLGALPFAPLMDGPAGSRADAAEQQFERLLADPDFQDGSVITAWNELVVTIASEVDQWFSLLGHRTLTMMHIAMHDALNAIVPVYNQYAHSEGGVAARPVVAASQAARDVAVAAYPDHAERFDALHQEWLDQVPDDERTAEAVALGRAAAAAIIERREGDNFDAEGAPYEPGSQPGDYRFTEPFDFAFGTGWADAEPFGLQSADQFRAAPPPVLSGEEYAAAFDEIRAMGRQESGERTDDQTHIAHWWAEFCETWCSRLGRQLAEEQDLHLWRAARLFALFHMDNFDGYVTNFESKYHYGFWRPVTAIRQADTDGNPHTEPVSDWMPEMETLPIPDYPSAHAQACHGAAEIFAGVFGTSEVSFTMDSMTAPEEGRRTRSYESFDQAAEDCGLSRIYNGFHFRFAVDAGARQGRERARFILNNHLQRRPEVDHSGLESF